MSFAKKKNVFWTILGAFFFIVVIYFLSKHTDLITIFLQKSGPWAPIVATILYPLLAITPITTDPITLIVSVIYGPLIGTLIAILGNLSAAVVEYFVGSKIGTVANFEAKKNKLPFGLGKMPVSSPAFLILGRMIPGYGSKIISFLAGIYKVKMKTYLWTTLVTTALGSALLSYGGFGLIHLIKNIVKVFTSGL